MSIGNLKDYGNKGNNFPWQLKMLQGLQCICDEVKEINIDTDDLEQLLADLIAELAAGINVNVTNGTGTAAVNIRDGGNSITVDATSLPLPTGAATEVTLAAVNTKLTSAARTPNILTDVGVGLTPTGIYSFSIANVGTAAGLVNGQSVPAGVTINFDAGALNNTLNSLPYNASGTTFIITWIS